jgi:alginate O-acetyltransferase complex protein AlgI
MLFSGLVFLIYFLPAVILLHWIAPRPAKNALLVLASVFFYAWGEMRYVPLILASLALNYAFGLGCGSRKGWLRALGLGLSLAVNFGALAYFKYAVFLMTTVGLGDAAPQVALPLGLSFYTFQTQAYVIDVHRRKVPAERNFVDYATFLLLFPQLIAGPIVLYTDVRRELKARTITAAGLESGMTAFIEGLSLKVLLANPLGALWKTVQGLGEPSGAALWLGILAFGLQIYFDFSGYSRMAIGMGRMLGFAFPPNFRHPYAARSIRDFWRRWHMTLSGWFREYAYFPLGGNLRGSARTVLNLLIVWALTGLWHGASWYFVAWGLWFFVCLVLERFWIGGWLARHPRWALLYTLWVVLMGWVLFAHESLSDAAAYALRMYSFAPGMDWLFPLRGNAALLLVSGLCCVPPVMERVRRALNQHAALRTAAMLGALLLCIAGLVNADYNPFLYFRF